MTFLVSHWRALLVCLLLAGAFVGGYMAHPDAPARVEVQEKVVYKDRVVEVEKRVEVKAATKVVYRDRVITRDGTVTEHEVEKTETKSDTRTDTSKTAEKQGHSETSSQTRVASPDWRVGALVGLDARSLAPLTPSYGVIVERRILGPVSAGIWALNTGPQVGLVLSVEF